MVRHHLAELPLQNQFHRLPAEAGGQRAIERRRAAPALQVAEDDISRLLSRQVLELFRDACPFPTQALDVALVRLLDDRRALIPGTGYLESACAAAKETLGAEWCEIRDVSFLSPLAVGDDETREMRMIVRKDGMDASFEVLSRATDGGADEAWTMHAQGSLRRLDGEAPAPIDINAMRAACPSEEHAPPGEHLRTGQFDHVEFGPRWNCLKASKSWRSRSACRKKAKSLPMRQRQCAASKAAKSGMDYNGTTDFK